MPPQPPLVVVGLGNPGAGYDGTRHNLGFLVVDELSRRHGIAVTRSKFSALWGQGRLGGEQVVLVKPQTYMNLSGDAVQPLARFFQAPPARVLVVCDDFSIDLGALRLRAKGSDGGHNGLKSLIARLGTQEFPRLRMGMGPLPPHFDVADFVLSRFARADHEAVQQLVQRAADAVECFAEHGLDTTMNRFNR